MTVYTVKEHLILEDSTAQPAARDLLKARLLSFGMVLMPRGNLRRCQLALRADGKLHAFVGRLPTPEFYGLIQALGQAESLEFIGLYEYEWESWWEQSRGADPYSLSRLFLRRDAPRELFYSLYVGDEADPGEIVAYGRKNGRRYRGVVPMVPLESLPAWGQWYVPITAVSYQEGDLKTVDPHEILGTCRQLKAMGGQEAMKISKHGFRFALRNLELRTPEAVEAYLSLCRELQTQTGGKCSAWEELVDLSAADPRMLELTPGPAGLPTIRMTLL